MKHHPLEAPIGRITRGAALVTTLMVASGCSLSTGPDGEPSTAVVHVEGSSPNPLQLITSTEFTEQFNTTTLEYIPVLLSADTIEISLPYDATLGMGQFSSIYVELLQPETSTATVRMTVDLDNGEGYDQSATLTDRAALIYYYLFTEYVL